MPQPTQPEIAANSPRSQSFAHNPTALADESAPHSPRTKLPEINFSETLFLTAWRDYFETAQHVIAHLEERLRNETGADLGELNILIALAEAPQQTLQMAKLASKLVFSAARLNYRVKVFESRGWITKVSCPNDKRASNLQLTEAGKQVLFKIGAVHHRHIREIFLDKLSTVEIQTLAEISQKLAQAQECDGTTPKIPCG